MLSTIKIEAKVVGQRRKLFSDWSITVPPTVVTDGGRTTLRDLITWTVTEEVAAFTERQEKRRLEQVLSRDQITDGAMRGKIESGGQALQQSVDPAQAVAVALQAFEDGIYFVFVDDQHYPGIDDVVYLKPDTHILFLRLVALVGG